MKVIASALIAAILGITTVSGIRFEAVSLRSGGVINELPLTARGGFIFLGGNTSSSCPPQVKPHCPPGKKTVFIVNNKSETAAMDVEVPGGQQLYISPNGALRFTEAHDPSMPRGSHVTGFQVPPPSSPGGVQTLNFTGAGASTFYSCGGKHQVYADVRTTNKTFMKCRTFAAVIGEYLNTAPAAWEYT